MTTITKIVIKHKLFWLWSTRIFSIDSCINKFWKSVWIRDGNTWCSIVKVYMQTYVSILHLEDMISLSTFKYILSSYYTKARGHIHNIVGKMCC